METGNKQKNKLIKKGLNISLDHSGSKQRNLNRAYIKNRTREQKKDNKSRHASKHSTDGGGKIARKND